MPRANRDVANAHPMAAVSPDFTYVREYRQGDDPRHIHWASWARTGRPAIKMYQEKTGPSVGLVLDTAVHHTRDVQALESGISAVAGIATYLLREGIEVDCFVTEKLLHCFPNDAPNLCLTHLIHTLAGLQPSTSVEWSSVATRLFALVPRCHTIVLIVLDWSRETAGFVTQLQDRGIGVRTLVIRQGPTSLPRPSAEPPSLLLPGNPWPQEPSRSPWRGP